MDKLAFKDHSAHSARDGPAVAKLLLESGGERREVRVFGPVTIGRSKTSTVYVDNKTLSREHTLVYEDKGRYYVRDLNSKNGTRLNDVTVTEAELLADGDLIKLGPKVSLVFIMDPAEVAAAPPTPRRPAKAVAPPPPVAPVTTPSRPRSGTPTERAVPSPPSAARARPRERSAVQLANPLISLVFNAIVVGVAIIGVFVFKSIFSWLLLRMDP